MTDTDPTLPGVDLPPVPPPVEEPTPKAPRSKADTTPRKRTAKAAGGRPTNTEAAEKELRRQLTDAIMDIGMAVAMIGTSDALMADGTAIMDRAEKLADSLVVLSRKNPAVARFLSGGITGSAYLGVVAAFGGLAITIASNHGLMPDGVGAVLNPAADAGLGATNVTDIAEQVMARMTPEQRAAAFDQAAAMFGQVPTPDAADAAG